MPHILSLDFSVSSSESQAHIGHPHQLPLVLGIHIGWKGELDSGHSVESEPCFLFLTLSPVGRAPESDVHWLIRYLQGAECCCGCSAQVAPLVPYQHIFDSVALVPFFFFLTCAFTIPQSVSFLIFLFSHPVSPWEGFMVQ